MRQEDMKSVTLYVKFRLGDVVYMRIAKQKYAGMVTGYHVRPTGTLYAVTWEGCEESSHYDIELTAEFIPDFSADNCDD